uniref:DNA-directed primase/polymerase protein n=1 Tax=Sexangularia sp. CB-2014 TaxID=1486929 RepID=A0A7S1VG23_9EUKA|mmetsp:Transcript_3022/g.9895  ORF Transcript_3022/g.9895 Transcript_3022/m.9895 type:complete len:543 (+) Transcript_3022:164-1792(+)
MNSAFYGSQVDKARFLLRLRGKRAESTYEGASDECERGCLATQSTVPVAPPTFSRQSDALAHAAAPTSFVVGEAQAGGWVRYRVAPCRLCFWRWYHRRPPSAQHLYELIRESSPCHGYADLEFARHSDVSDNFANEPRLRRFMTALAELEADAARDGLACLVPAGGSTPPAASSSSPPLLLARAKATPLFSSNARKFSAHLVFHLPNGSVFQNNREVGRLVQLLLTRAAADPERHADLFAPDGSSIVDGGVYTRNRLMRLYLSKKHGQGKERLLPLVAPSSRAVASVRTYRSSLVTTAPDDTVTTWRVNDELVDAFRKRYGTLAKVGGIGGGTQSAGAGVEVEVGEKRSREGFAASRSGGSDDAVRLRRVVVPSTSASPSDHPLLADAVSFVVDMVTGHGGKVRRTTWFPDTGLVTCALAGYRYCHRIGRQHRSNNVSLTISLDRRVFWQSCTDPECSGWRSNEWPLPQHVGGATVDGADGADADEGFEAALVAAAAADPASFGDADFDADVLEWLQRQQEADSTAQEEEWKDNGDEGDDAT